MRRALLACLVALSAGALTLALCSCARQSSGDGDNKDGSAEAALERLSSAGSRLTYRVVYESADHADRGSINQYVEPGLGWRFDLGTPINADEDAEQQDDLLKSGDILILSERQPQRLISCRTVRGSCRSLDGFEGLAVALLVSLFTYDKRLYDQPHTVTRVDDLSAAGETAQCFLIEARPGTASEQATAQDSGFLAGEGLPKTLCYARDGLPLGGLVGDGASSQNWIKATEVQREVDDSVFEPPFPMVPSRYDRTPSAGQ